MSVNKYRFENKEQTFPGTFSRSTDRPMVVRLGCAALAGPAHSGIERERGDRGAARPVLGPVRPVSLFFLFFFFYFFSVFFHNF